ncbi:hypothetical protein ABBQ38_003455 [Trebouxia sp. C0009 RCD-2024]
MMDAPPLDYGRSSLHGRANSFPRSGSFTAAQLPALTSAAFGLDISCQPSDLERSSDYRAPPSCVAGASSQRQRSGDMASTSYLQPVRVNGMQHGSSSVSQPSSPYIIEVDDDSLLPMQRRPQADTLFTSRHHSSNLEPQNSGNLVDLTGESPSAAQLPIRHPIDLESIGSGSLRRTSCELGKQQNLPRHPQNRRSGHRHTADNSVSARTHMGASEPGRLGVYANGSSTAADSICHQVGDYLDITGLQSRQHRPVRSSSSLQPAHRSSVINSPGHGHLEGMHQQRGGRAMLNQHQMDLHGGNVSLDARRDAATQEEMDLALAMSLAAEDEEEGRFYATRHFPHNRHRQPHTRSGANFFQPYSSRSDPIASIAHSLLGGGGHVNAEVLATLMAEFDRAANAAGTASGSGQQDLSYEALTNLEDVKLTAPPELLATMPLDMCLKGGQWDDKVHDLSNVKQCIIQEGMITCTSV